MEKRSNKSTPPSTQRFGSSMTIDTTMAQNAYASQLQRKSLSQTQQQLRRRSVYSSEPIMSPEELTSKIADNFQQFSSMLNQLQKPMSPHSPGHSRPTTPMLPTRLSRPNSIDNKYTRRYSLKEVNSSNKNTTPTWLLSPVSMVSPPPLPTKYPTPKKKYVKATQDIPLVTKFLRAASNGDTHMVESLIHQFGNLVYDTDTEDGTTALIYAACFGHLSTVTTLLDAGAPVNEQDHYGWTALMWGTVNHHDSVVSLLLSRGAIQETSSIHGTTAFDLVLDHHPSVMANLLSPTYSRRHSLTMDRIEKRKKGKQQQRQLLKSSRRQSTPVIATNNRFQHSGGMDAYTHFMTTESEHHQRLTQRHELFYDALLTLKKNGDDGNWTDHMDDDADVNGMMDSSDDDDQQILDAFKTTTTNRPFSWDTCLVDQMFVFSMNDLDTILDVALDTRSIPTKNDNDKDGNLWLPANVLFLCSRFAYYYSERGTLAQFLEVAINRITKVSKQNTKNTSLFYYWMTNTYQLLVYLRHDTGLERNTVHQQQQLADLMTDIYLLLIRNHERQLGKLIPSALLDYESTQGMAPVDFEDANDWSTFFQRRGSIRVSMDSLNGADNNNNNESVGPHAITATLEGIQILMTTVYELPRYMVDHTIAQCLHYVLCEGFNQILENKIYLCRSKAQHIRMNLSVLEEWTRQMGELGNSMMDGLDRLAQLLQLLQCVSELDDVDALKDLIRGLNLLDAVQIKHSVVKYRYETQEPHLPKCVEEWVVQQAQHQQQQKQQKLVLDRSSNNNNNNNMRQLKDFLLGNYSNKDSRDNKVVGGPCIHFLSVDSHWILPFDQKIVKTGTRSSLLVTNHKVDKQDGGLSADMYLEIKQKAERDKKESIRIPSLPYKFIDRLDKKLHK